MGHAGVHITLCASWHLVTRIHTTFSCQFMRVQSVVLTALVQGCMAMLGVSAPAGTCPALLMPKSRLKETSDVQNLRLKLSSCAGLRGHAGDSCALCPSPPSNCPAPGHPTNETQRNKTTQVWLSLSSLCRAAWPCWGRPRTVRLASWQPPCLWWCPGWRSCSQTPTPRSRPQPSRPSRRWVPACLNPLEAP